MSFRACAVVPIYDPPDTLGQVVGALRAHGLPVILVDDGSDADTKARIAESVRADPAVACVTLPENRGKGAAVMAGLRRAAELGYTHALQVDADGQHDTTDVPALLSLAERHPAHLVSGAPRYDALVPKARYYGRYLTHTMVWFETLSLSLEDSMCGFRVYPIAACLALDAQVRLGRRMDFDTDIMVRLYWAGTETLFLPTRVRYPPGGRSHFRLWQDNVRMTWLHIRLGFGMLPHAPALLLRRYRRRRARHWAEMGERGTTFGMRIITRTYSLLGRRVSHLFLLPVVAYFLVFHPEARRGSQKFLTRVRPYSARSGITPHAPGWRSSFRHFWQFAVANLDMFAAWRDPQRVTVHFPEQDLLVENVRHGRGALLISAHLGNLEVTRALATLVLGLRINALVYTQHARKSNTLLEQVNDAYGLRLIHVQQLGPETAVMLRDKVKAGEVVVIVGDRTPVSADSPVVHCDFLGEPAPFAVGPYILAHLLECPVFLFFCLQEGDGYTIHLEKFSEAVHLPRRGRGAALQRWAGRYAERLAYYAARFPLQWYNFYDFWADRRLAPTGSPDSRPSGTTHDAQHTHRPV